ncbi:hypothetical protein B296_00028491 [Ensete ventricosum]|uniref:Methyltransferase type 11 domain-containing protein n=1 Tax=Ensete ventricosum TaxID=4639 RepID=A0A427A1L6_ENSVE|nr:hypothetical protein B296_00028491 [Ensete ventricosum]
MMMSSSQRHAYSYGDALYWDARYLADGSASFDWYQRYSALRPFVRKYVPVSARVLMVGCGNADMQMDVRDMSFFDDESFDCVFDKGTKLRFKSYIRTLDSLMLDCNFVWILVWHGCSTQCLSDARRSEQVLVSSSFRLLRPGGIYMLVNTGS